MKNFFLSLLSHEPTHGYDLLQIYADLFAAVLPPLNAGQIYTTLSRLERDGLVSRDDIEQAGKPDKRVYALTEQGRQALQAWFVEPVSGPRIKDNFYLKLVSASICGLAEPAQLINTQRQHYIQTLHDLNNLVLGTDLAQDPSRLLLVQGAILHLKADLEWLDLCEESFSRGEGGSYGN
jgi:DNA-binding PadR family transcriptional regulator